MNFLPEISKSYWIASTEDTDHPSLDSDIKVDAAIIGGGITGITTAYLLKKEGLKVAIIEADRILKGTTGHTTAKITSQHYLIYDKISKQMGKEKAKQYADANEYAIDFIENIIKEKNIDCNFERCPAYIYTLSEKYIDKIQDEANAASDLGINAMYSEDIPLPFKVKAAVRFENQAQFHPRKYLLELAKEIPGNGSYIFEQTRAIDIEEGNLCNVITNRRKKITASYVIEASHFPFYDGRGLYFAKLFPDRSYALGVRIKEKFPGGMYITAEDPGRSLRSLKADAEELVICSGEHHKTGQGGSTMVHYVNLKSFMESTFDVEEIKYMWSTQDYNTADGVPYTGRLTKDKQNIYVATGFGKWGMTNGTVSAVIIKDLIIKGENQWKDVYDPSRFVPSPEKIKNYVVENLNVAGQLVKGKLSPALDDLQIKKGEARIVEIDGKKMGAYKDNKGIVHVVDTTCTHLGCELSWNDAEKTWDCPCHGSRFTYEGEIVEGPALNQLNNSADEKNKIDPNIV